MKKVQLSTVKREANIQVIEIDAHLVFCIADATFMCEHLIDAFKHPKQEWDKEKQECMPVLDGDGNQLFDYDYPGIVDIETRVLPILQEIARALKEG